MDAAVACFLVGLSPQGSVDAAVGKLNFTSRSATLMTTQ